MLLLSLLRITKIIIIVLLILSVMGCQENTLQYVFIGLDLSGSAEILKKFYFGLLDAIVSIIAKGKSYLTFYSFNAELNLLWSGKPVKNCLWPVQDKVLSGKDHKKGTRVDLFIKEFLKEKDTISAKRIHLILIWDGEDDLIQTPLEPMIKKISEDKRVITVVILGIKPENRIKVNNIFKPLGPKLITAGLYDPKEAIKEFKNRYLQN